MFRYEEVSTYCLLIVYDLKHCLYILSIYSWIKDYLKRKQVRDLQGRKLIKQFLIN